MSVRPMISSRRSVWASSSWRPWSPLTTGMPSTSTCGHWIIASSVCMLLPPGPEQFSLTRTLRGSWDHAAIASSVSAIARQRPPAPRVRLEQKLKRKLNQTRVIHRGVNRAEARCTEFRARGADAAAGGAELRMIEQIEDFEPEIEPHPLAPGQQEVLDRREVRIHKVRARHRSAGRVP